MHALVNRIKLETADRLKYSPLLRDLISRYQRWTAADANGDQQARARSIQKLCAAARFASSIDKVRSIQKQIRQHLEGLRPAQVDWSAFVDDVDNPRVSRGLVLKPWLGPREKGVLFISFEKDWFKLLQHCDLGEFSRHYSLVVAPSSSPHNLPNYVFAAAYPEKLYTLISNAGDWQELPRIASNFVVVPLYASQWVLPELFQPRPLAERDVDLIMVANFAKVKRHHALFSALRRMSPKLRVLLVGQDQDGRTADTIRREASAYGIGEQLTIASNVCYAGVADFLCRARASVILSRREGSCVVVAESLFANTPCALLQHAEIGSRAFINPQTGVFLDEKHLDRQLTELIERAENFSPRQWAEANISCHASSQTLNGILKQDALAQGQEWTQDIAPFCWRPDPRLVKSDDESRLEESRMDVKCRFGVDVGPKHLPSLCGKGS
jgi:hypothetical protein